MKLIRTFQITADEFYDFLEEQLLLDIEKTINRAVTAKELKKGFRYEKKQANTVITIEEYKRNEVYSTTAKSRTDFITVTYRTKDTKEGLEITFEEYLSSYDSIRDKKNPLSRGLHDWITFGRMSRTLYDMRSDILNRREGIKTKKPQQPEVMKGLRKKLEKKLNE